LNFAKTNVAKVSQKPLDLSWNVKLADERRKKNKPSLKQAKREHRRVIDTRPKPPRQQPQISVKGSKKKLRQKIKQLEKRVAMLSQASTSKEPGFYDSREWKELRYKAIKQHGRTCMACRTTDGVMHVDHIKPRSKFPDLELELSNLQILCADCNIGKSNKDSTDWRPA
jgi:hypothetical protein